MLVLMERHVYAGSGKIFRVEPRATTRSLLFIFVSLDGSPSGARFVQLCCPRPKCGCPRRLRIERTGASFRPMDTGVRQAESQTFRCGTSPVGTSEGIKQISHGAGDFGAGEAPLTEKERKEDGLIELPVVLIGIVPIYNLPDGPPGASAFRGSIGRNLSRRI